MCAAISDGCANSGAESRQMSVDEIYLRKFILLSGNDIGLAFGNFGWTSINTELQKWLVIQSFEPGGSHD